MEYQNVNATLFCASAQSPALGHQGVNTALVLIRCKMNSLLVANDSFDPNQTI